MPFTFLPGLGINENMFWMVREKKIGIYLYFVANDTSFLYIALSAGKHVLLKDTVSTPRAEFEEQMEYAKKANKFIQFSTMVRKMLPNKII
jgi:hypothetical protein